MPKQRKLHFSAAAKVPADKAPNPESAPRDHANAPQRGGAPDDAPGPSLQFSDISLSTAITAMTELPDSTDWIATSLPTFEPLEAALRCEVCKEFFENPVITSCSHTFCSLCIRRCITNDGKCPACKAHCQSERLVPNFVVREIVARFQVARPRALELARKKEGEEAATPSARGKRRKRKMEDVDADFEDAEPTRHTRSRITRSTSGRSYANGMADAPFEVPDSDEEPDEENAEYLPAGTVACPLCQAAMKEALVWAHMDSGCQTPKGARSQRTKTLPKNPPQTHSKKPPPPPSRLPGLNYNLLKDNALRKKLDELGIPQWGKKELLIRRHTEWLHLWNSNCDAAEDRQKSKRELLRELDVWERTRGGSAHNAEVTVMRKDFDTQGHADTHRSQFDDLIAAARKKAAERQAEKKEEVPNEEVPNTQDKDGDTEMEASQTEPERIRDSFEEPNKVQMEDATQEPYFSVEAFMERRKKWTNGLIDEERKRKDAQELEARNLEARNIESDARKQEAWELEYRNLEARNQEYEIRRENPRRMAEADHQAWRERGHVPSRTQPPLSDKNEQAAMTEEEKSSIRKAEQNQMIKEAGEKLNLRWAAEKSRKEEAARDLEMRGAAKEHIEDPAPPEPQHIITDPSRPYEGNEAALASIREKVEETNLHGAIIPPAGAGVGRAKTPDLPSARQNVTESGIRNPFGSPSKKLPMFTLPEDPVRDVENSTAVP